jgi:cobalt-zinc-cadmium efflux system protein
MAHTHSHSPPGDDNAKRLLLAFGVTATFMIIEVIGGWSPALWRCWLMPGICLPMPQRCCLPCWRCSLPSSPNARHTFGWLRLTTLAAFVNAIALVVITILIVWEAIQRFSIRSRCRGDNDGDCRRRAAGEYPGLLDFASRQRRKEPQRARGGSACAGDLLGSVGAIVAALVILYTGWTPVDPILSVLVSCLVCAAPGGC